MSETIRVYVDHDDHPGSAEGVQRLRDVETGRFVDTETVLGATIVDVELDDETDKMTLTLRLGEEPLMF